MVAGVDIGRQVGADDVADLAGHTAGAAIQRLQQRENLIDTPDRPFILTFGAFLLADDEIVLHRMIRKDLPVLGHKAEPGARDDAGERRGSVGASLTRSAG